MNGSNDSGLKASQSKTQEESVQKWTLLSGMPIGSFRPVHKAVPSSHPMSSSLGIDVRLSFGDKRALDIKNLMLELSLVLLWWSLRVTMYATAANPISLASQKM
jgi:hypothetical protein